MKSKNGFLFRCDIKQTIREGQTYMLTHGVTKFELIYYTKKNWIEMLHYLWCSCVTTLEGNCSAVHRLAGLLFCGLTALPQLPEGCRPTGGNAAASHINLDLTILFNGQFDCFDISKIVVNYYIYFMENSFSFLK